MASRSTTVTSSGTRTPTTLRSWQPLTRGKPISLVSHPTQSAWLTSGFRFTDGPHCRCSTSATTSRSSCASPRGLARSGPGSRVRRAGRLAGAVTGSGPRRTQPSRPQGLQLWPRLRRRQPRPPRSSSRWTSRSRQPTSRSGSGMDPGELEPSRMVGCDLGD